MAGLFDYSNLTQALHDKLRGRGDGFDMTALGAAGAGGTLATTLLYLAKRKRLPRNLLSPVYHNNYSEVTGRIRGGMKNRPPVLSSLLDKLQLFQSPHYTGVNARRGESYVDYLMAGGKGLQKSVAARHSNLGFDKYNEALAFGPSMPATALLKDLIGRSRSPAIMRSRIEDRLGKNWILKSRAGFATGPDNLVTEATTDRDLLRYVRSLSDRGSAIAQRRIEMAQPNWLFRKLDTRLAGRFPSLSNAARGTTEYRVHAFDGKVAPFATTQRGSVMGAATDMILPSWLKPRTRQVEAFTQDVLNKLPAKHKRNVSFGFDIGVGRDGKPFLIESNPTSGEVYRNVRGKPVLVDPGGGSGYMSNNPSVRDAMAAHAVGRLPSVEILRRAGFASGGLLGSGLMADTYGM